VGVVSFPRGPRHSPQPGDGSARISLAFLGVCLRKPMDSELKRSADQIWLAAQALLPSERAAYLRTEERTPSSSVMSPRSVGSPSWAGPYSSCGGSSPPIGRCGPGSGGICLRASISARVHGETPSMKLV
jgi:hypothetical protein